MRIIDKLLNSYKCIMKNIFNREYVPCCVMKLFTFVFFFMSLYMFFMSGRYFEFGYYGQFGWYMMGGILAYSIYWLSLKQICWSQLRNKNISYEECCVKKRFEKISNNL